MKGKKWKRTPEERAQSEELARRLAKRIEERKAEAATRVAGQRPSG